MLKKESMDLGQTVLREAWECVLEDEEMKTNVVKKKNNRLIKYIFFN
jgi:hypothetical protein